MAYQKWHLNHNDIVTISGLTTLYQPAVSSSQVVTLKSISPNSPRQPTSKLRSLPPELRKEADKLIAQKFKEAEVVRYGIDTARGPDSTVISKRIINQWQGGDADIKLVGPINRIFPAGGLAMV